MTKQSRFHRQFSLYCLASQAPISPNVNQLITEFLCKFFLPQCRFKYPIRSQFCTCHDSWAVMTCAKLLPELIIIFHIRATNIFNKFVIWAPKPCVRWMPDTELAAIILGSEVMWWIGPEWANFDYVCTAPGYLSSQDTWWVGLYIEY